MSENIYIKLNKEYEQKRVNAVKIAKYKKDIIMKQVPEYERYESLINKKAIETAKKMINMDSKQKEKQKKILEREIMELRKKINCILKENGYSDNDFKLKYECQYCSDTGYIQENGVNSMCSCYRQRVIEELMKNSNLNNIEHENFTTFEFGYYSNRIDLEKYHSELSPRDNILKNKHMALQFIENFENHEEKNILFTGKTGLGKTFLTNCIANELLNKGYTVIYQTAPYLMDKIIDYKFNKDNSKESEDFNREIKNADLLIIDDLGTETTNNYRYEELFNIINYRINTNKKIIISTNLSLKDIQARYDERISSRIIGEFNSYRFYGDDIRLVKKRLNK